MSLNHLYRFQKHEAACETRIQRVLGITVAIILLPAIVTLAVVAALFDVTVEYCLGPIQRLLR
jgi:hypothetical protein